VTHSIASPYVVEYQATFTFAAPPERVWAVLERFETLAPKWTWLRELRIEGAGLRKGTVVHGVVVPPLPYRMRLDVALDDCAPSERIDASVHGDLEGSAHIAFNGDGRETRADASWTIEMTQPAMRFAARLAPGLLRWGHDRVVIATVNSLRRQLAEHG
jgi:carbon monoxide dehydrogenase subunit G